MKNKAFHIDRYTFTEKDILLFDANIWCFIYGRQDPTDCRIRIYSKALANALKAKSRILIDVLVLSEFINRYSRIEHTIAKASGGANDFKSFRKSPKFKTVVVDIVAASRRILKHCERTGSGFELLDIDLLLSDHQTKCPDFNDQVLAAACKANSLKLVTHDGDFND